MALFVIYKILCLSVILCHSTLVHNSGSCQNDACEQQQHIIALEQRIRALEGKQASYAFMAQTRQRLTHPADGHHMVFEDVIANVGGAYDKYNGTFVVPVSGTYAFSYHLMVSPLPGHLIKAFLKQNGNIIGHALCDDDHFEMCGDESVIHANTGDDIYITLTIEGKNIIRTGQMKTHFQGFLIRQD